MNEESVKERQYRLVVVQKVVVELRSAVFGLFALERRAAFHHFHHFRFIFAFLFLHNPAASLILAQYGSFDAFNCRQARQA